MDGREALGRQIFRAGGRPRLTLASWRKIAPPPPTYTLVRFRFSPPVAVLPRQRCTMDSAAPRDAITRQHERGTAARKHGHFQRNFQLVGRQHLVEPHLYGAAGPAGRHGRRAATATTCRARASARWACRAGGSSTATWPKPRRCRPNGMAGCTTLVDTPPTEEKYAPRPWQKPHRMNMTGTAAAYRPSGTRPRRRPAAPCPAPATHDPVGPADQVGAVHLRDLLHQAAAGHAEVDGLAGGVAEPVQERLRHGDQPGLGAAAPGVGDEHLAGSETARPSRWTRPLRSRAINSMEVVLLASPVAAVSSVNVTCPEQCTTRISSCAARSTACVPLGRASQRESPREPEFHVTEPCSTM